MYQKPTILLNELGLNKERCYNTIVLPEREDLKGNESLAHHKETAPAEPVVYDNATLDGLMEEIEYGQDMGVLSQDQIRGQVDTIVLILIKHSTRTMLTAEQNAALATRVRQIRNKLEAVPATSAPPVTAAKETLVLEDPKEIAPIDPDILHRVHEAQTQIEVITDLLKNPDFNPGSHKLMVSYTRTGAERAVPVIEYLTDEKQILIELLNDGVFNSDTDLRENVVRPTIARFASLSFLCKDRQKQRELQLTEEAQRNPLYLAVTKELETISQDIAVGRPIDYTKAKGMLEGRSAEVATELAAAGISTQLSELLTEIQKKLHQQINTLVFHEQSSTYIPRWQKIIDELPASNREMAKKGITLEQMKATKNSLQELYEEMKKSGLLDEDGTQDGATTTLKRRILQKTQEAVKFIDEQLLKLPDPQQMTINEVVKELLGSTGIYDTDVRYAPLKNRYEALVDKITDEYLRALHKNAIGTLSAGVAATSKANDYAKNLNKVEAPFAGDGGTMATLALMLFEGSEKERSMEEFLNGTVPIDTRAIQLWDFIVDRIKNSEKFGGSGSTVKDLIPQNPGETAGAYKLRLTIIESSKGDAAKLNKLLPALKGETAEERQERIHKIRTGSSMSRFEYDEELVKKLPTESDAQFATRLQKIAALDQSFAYGSLMEHVVTDFEKVIDLVFADIDSTKREILKSFYKTFGAKSAAYMAYLMRGTTRGHGFAPKEAVRDDESRFANPFALRMYKATRYDKLTRARFMSRFMYLPKPAFVALLAQSFDKNYPAKAESAKEIYELYELFYKSRWGDNLPLWLIEGRELFTSDEFAHIEIPEHMDEHQFEEWVEELREKRIFDGAAIDLDGTLFPLIPDVATSVMKVEQKRTELQQRYKKAQKDKAAGRITPQAFIRIENSFKADVEALVEKYRHQGYFNYSSLTKAEQANDHVGMLKACYGQRILLGGHDSPNFTVAQYGLAAEAVEKMFEIFDSPVTAKMSVKDAHHKMQTWCADYIGKAKLVPGPHHLLFAPFTCELLTNILNSFKGGEDQQQVKTLYRELMKDYIKAGGMPAYVYEEVLRLMGGDENNPPDYCVYAHRNRPLIGPDPYLRLLWLIENESDSSPATNLGRKNPMYAPGPWRSPYAHEAVVDKDTTEKSGDSGKH